MMGRKEIAVKKVGALNLREVSARATLRSVRQQGHVYVELRPVAKRSIFFCTLCLTKCFSEDVLYAHLKGNLHSRRYASAKITLLLPNPWPFNDGVLFFNISRENDPGESRKSVVSAADDGGSARCDCDDLTSNHLSSVRDDGHEKIRKCRGVQEHLTVPYVLPNEDILNFELKIIGYGHIDAKIYDDSEGSNTFSKIWCAWLGDGNFDDCDDELASSKCDFAIVNISYTFDLGKRCTIEDENRPPDSGSFFQFDEFGGRIKRRKKSFSDPEDSSEAFKDKSDYCNSDKSSRHVLNRSPIHSFRKQNPSKTERNCDICRQPLLPGKDVATLLNLKTGRFACSSRNVNGAFHLFHASCLIHWILLSEFELWVKQSINAKGSRGRKRKTSMKSNNFSSIFCPECQGTGINIHGDVLEKPTVPLSETFLYKLEIIKAHKAWMRNPENLQKCSTGLCFSSETTMKLKGKVMPSKLLLFYRAYE